MTSQASQVTSKRNVKVNITAYPKISGKAKDWVAFERKFRSVASFQGFDYDLQDLDSAFIHDAFQNSWADSMNFYLVEHNKKNKNGKGLPWRQELLQGSCTEVCHPYQEYGWVGQLYKLTHTTHPHYTYIMGPQDSTTRSMT